MAYLSNMGFNVSYKLDGMDKAYKGIVKQTDLDKKSPGRNTEQFDEIVSDKHTLTDVYLCHVLH